jgi:PST family polysaccharide transporter
MCGNLLLTVFLARELGVANFGTLNYFLALVAIISPLSSLGMNSILTRDVINNPNDKLKIFTSATYMRVLGSVIGIGSIMIIGFLFLDLSKTEYSYLIILACLSFTSAFQGLEFWFQSEINMKPVVIFRMLNFVFFSLFKVFVLASSLSFYWLIVVFGCELFFTGVGYVVLFVLNKGSVSPKYFDLEYSKTLFKKALWLLFSSIAAIIYLKIDQVMLAEMVSREEVGIYSVAVRLSEVWYFFAMAIVSSVFPILLKAKKQSNAIYYKKLQYTCDLLCWVAILLAIVVQLLGEYFVVKIFGDEYVESAVILSIHIWSGVFVYMRALVSKWILAEDCLHISLVSQGIGSVINVFLNLVLIPLYGGKGAAIATLISYSVSGFLIFYVTEQTRPMANVMWQSILLPFMSIKRYKYLKKELK